MKQRYCSPPIDGYPGVVSNISNDWERVRDLAQERYLKKNTIFSFDGDASQDFAYVLRGLISIVYYECNGQSKTQIICNEGSLINEVNIVTGYHKNKVNYISNCDSIILYFSKHIVTSVIFPKFPELMKSIAYGLSVKLMKFQVLFNAVCTRNRLQLVCWYILSMSQCHDNAREFTPGLTQEQIRSLLGLKKTSMKRSMAWLKSENIVPVFTKRRIRITDYERLVKLALPEG